MKLHEIRTIGRELDEVFAFTADFSNASTWDPGVEVSRQVGDGPPEVGTEYELIVRFGSRRIPMRYVITELEADERVVLHGESQSVSAVDEIKFESSGAQTIVEYTAHIAFGNWLRFVEPLMAPILKRTVARKALDGLVAVLER